MICSFLWDTGRLKIAQLQHSVSDKLHCARYLMVVKEPLYAYRVLSLYKMYHGKVVLHLLSCVYNMSLGNLFPDIYI